MVDPEFVRVKQLRFTVQVLRLLYASGPPEGLAEKLEGRSGLIVDSGRTGQSFEGRPIVLLPCLAQLAARLVGVGPSGDRDQVPPEGVIGLQLSAEVGPVVERCR